MRNIRILNNLGIKWIAYGFELLIVFVLQFTPGLVPTIFGVHPNMLLPSAVCIAVFEGEMAGLGYGVAAGLLMDFGGNHVFGFNALFTCVMCYICGLLVVYLMRNNIVSAMLMGLCSLLILGTFRWLFFYVLWGYPDLWYEYYAVVLPSVLYSLALMPIFFLFNRVLTTHLENE